MKYAFKDAPGANRTLTYHRLLAHNETVSSLTDEEYINGEWETVYIPDGCYRIYDENSDAPIRRRVRAFEDWND